MKPTGLLTDRYEIAMISSLLHNGKAHTPAIFEAFARKLPQGRRYGVVAGLERIVEAIQRHRPTNSNMVKKLSVYRKY